MEELRTAIRRHYLADEAACIERLLPLASIDAGMRARVENRARALVEGLRARRRGLGGLDAFLQEYGLGTHEGVVLMCLAEALLRIPDAATADRLIQDRLAAADWERHLGHSRSLFVNASTWGLMLTGRLVRGEPHGADEPASFLARLAARIGEPAARAALREAMNILARQFVMGRTIDEALARAHSPAQRPYLHSFDMLGEAALTAADAQRYFERYLQAIEAIGADMKPAQRDSHRAPGISIKLSALHPRFEFAQGERLTRELAPRVITLAEAARDAGIGLTVDAEEAERLEPTLDCFEAAYRAVAGYEGLGIAVQAYQKRALPVIDWLAALAEAHRRRIPVRLVKGAYWDTEIKRAQERGLEGYPVYTRKAATDVSWLACARRLLDRRALLYPQFATHNAHGVAAVLELAGNGDARRSAAAFRTDSEDRAIADGDGPGFEFQRLHGMGEALYAGAPEAETGVACRVYAPVGSHEDLLPYLVRRLLENGANTSFLHHVLDDTIPIERLIADPAERLRRARSMPHPRIPLPVDLYPGRRNTPGVNLHDADALQALAETMRRASSPPITAAPIVGGTALDGAERRVIIDESFRETGGGARSGAPADAKRPVTDPADARRTVGEVIEAGADAVDRAFALAAAAQPEWNATPAGERARILDHAAGLMECRRGEFIALLVHEGGKCLADADAELREAADYCRYYAQLARAQLAAPLVLPGPSGEHNELQLHGRGVFACISPWNFPLAIFTGQVTAVLAAGNAVLAKPASQTPLVAYAAVRLLHEAGVPADALHFLPGPGGALGARILGDPRLAGVVFTGSTETARDIHRRLAAREGPIVPLVAETGGLNAMIADSSALPEQLVQDALRSAFNSAGQRCSALRVLFVQEEIAPRVLRLLEGAVAEIAVGDPASIASDVGPVIQASAKAALEEHAALIAREGRLVGQAPLPPETAHGCYFAPRVFEIPRFDLLRREVFGPILHVVRYAARDLDGVIDAINASGYGLTLGVHTRVESTARHIQRRAHVGNTYVNRNQIGAVVGVQPFGGEGLSGTGPKAGGPHYLSPFLTERTLTLNTAAIGGNTALLGLDDEI